jgi:hypothetical protein
MRALTLLALVLSLAYSANAHAEDFEAWKPRDAQSIQAVEHPERTYVSTLRPALAELASFMIATYPAEQGYEIFYMARDGQLPYYAAKFLSESLGLADNHHLINVSKHTIKDPLLSKYLVQEGLIPALEAGRKVVVFDIAVNTGRNTNGLLAGIPEKLRDRVEMRTVVSGVPGLQQSRTFLAELEPKMQKRGAATLHEVVDSTVENGTPKSTRTAYQYRLIDGRVVPFASLESDHGWGNGRDPQGEKALLEDIKSHIMGNLDRYRKRLAFWRETLALPDAPVLARIESLLKSKSALDQAAASDLLELFALSSTHRRKAFADASWIKERAKNLPMIAPLDALGPCRSALSPDE